MTDGNMLSLDATDGHVVEVNIAIHMETCVGEIKGLVQILGSEGQLGVIRGLVHKQVRGASVEHDERFLRRKTNLNLARPSLVPAKTSLTTGALLRVSTELVNIFEVDNVQMLTRSVVMVSGNSCLLYTSDAADE